MLYVGDNNDIGDSVQAAKNVPATAGELVSPNSSPFNNYAVVANNALYYNQPTANPYKSPLSASPIYVPPMPNQGTTPASTYNLGPQYFPSSTPAPVNYHSSYTGSTPQSVHIYPSSTPSPVLYSTPSASPVHYYSSSPAPPRYLSSTPSPTHYYSSTPSPHYYSSTPSPIHYYPSSTPQVDIHPNAEPKYVYVSSTPATPTQTTPRPIAVYSQTPRPVAVNYVSPQPQSVTPSPSLSAIGYTASTPSPVQRPPPISGKFASPSNNNFITETEKNRQFYQYEQNRGYYKKRFVDYKPVEQEYDGISTVQNGFR